jgi:hypothetical protein
MAQQGASCRSSAPEITLVPLRANRSSFGPAHPVSKLLKFFKLFGQRSNTEPESKGTIVSLDTQQLPPTEKLIFTQVPQHQTLVQKSPLRCCKRGRTGAYCGVKKMVPMTEQH